MTSPDAPSEAPAILHVDMDAFFVSVELLRHPELRGKPVVVGGAGERGVVAAASYEARSFGIHSAMPAVRARRLCPHAVFLPGDHDHYSDVSRRVMEIFASVTPLVEPISLDEAFLDVSGARRLLGPAPTIAGQIRADISAQEGLRCSVGVARVKFLAKLASQAAKPRVSEQGPVEGDGVFVIDPTREVDFLHPLPVEALWGVGPATLTRLQRLGIHTVAQLAETPVATLEASLGSAHGRHLHDLANLRDARSVEPDRALKSVGHEETFLRDHHRMETLETELLRMADAVASRLRTGGLAGRTISLKVRFGDFRTITRSITLAAPTDSAMEITAAARDLLAGVDPSPGVRLLGVSVSTLGDGAVRQLSFDDLEGGSAEGQRDAQDAIDAVRARFGPGSVGPARLVGPGGLRVTRRGEQQWGPPAPG